MDEDDANDEDEQFSLEGVDVWPSLLLSAHKDGCDDDSKGKDS